MRHSTWSRRAATARSPTSISARLVPADPMASRAPCLRGWESRQHRSRISSNPSSPVAPTSMETPLTSKMGNQYIMEDLPKEERNRRVTEALRGHFRPEFLDRIDEIIIFGRLDDRQITRIVDIQLQRLVERRSRSNITLKLTEAAKKFLAKEGYDPAYGARPLKRVIQKENPRPLSLEILDGKFREGDHITVDAAEDHLVFNKS